MPQDWICLLEVLDTNRSLTWVNLSHNMLVSVKDQQDIADISSLLLSKNSRFEPIRKFIQEKQMQVSLLRR